VDSSSLQSNWRDQTQNRTLEASPMRFCVCSRPYAPGPAPTDYVFCPPPSDNWTSCTQELRPSLSAFRPALWWPPTPLTVPLEFDAGH
jgi:hypothetical protein